MHMHATARLELKFSSIPRAVDSQAKDDSEMHVHVGERTAHILVLMITKRVVNVAKLADTACESRAVHVLGGNLH